MSATKQPKIQTYKPDKSRWDKDLDFELFGEPVERNFSYYVGVIVWALACVISIVGILAVLIGVMLHE
jgi:hypothetical protein